MSDQSLLCLTMVVKDETEPLRATIASVRPFVDRYFVVLADASEALEAVLRAELDGLPGEFLREPFVDFGTHRTRALEGAAASSVFALSLDGDETLEGGEALRQFAEQHRDMTSGSHGAYLIPVRQDSVRSHEPRLVRAGLGGRYVGLTHETLVREKAPAPSLRVPDVTLTVDPNRYEESVRRARYQLNLRLLTTDGKQRPKDAHVVFATALTLEKLGETRRALTTFERRAKLGGKPEEVYESLLRTARLGKATGRPWPEVQHAALQAYTHSPHRAEPLFLLAWHYYECKNWPLTYLFAARAASLPLVDKSSLFVDEAAYGDKLDDLLGAAAYYVGEFAAGEAAIRRALGRHPEDERLQKNLSFYEAKTKSHSSKPAS